MSTVKKYRLLKDINMPYKNIKAGTVGVELVPSRYVSFGEGINSLAYSVSDIKKSPEWFEEVVDTVPERIKVETKDKEHIQICFGDAATGACFDYSVKQLKEILMKDMFPEQPSNDNAFVWTDALVLDFARYTYVDAPTMQGRYKDMEDFKKAHQSKQPLPTGTPKMPDDFIIAKALSKEQSAPLSPSIPDNTVDWEIVSFKHIDYGIMFKYSGGYYQRASNHGRGWCISLGEDLKNTKNMSIHSVRRISDNCLFTVGDEFDLYGGIDRKYKIDSFEVRGNLMYVSQSNYPDCAKRISLPHLIKLMPTDKPFEVNWDTGKLPSQPLPTDTDNPDTVTNNDDVACLSLNDLLEVWEDAGFNPKQSAIFKRFEKKAKQKLSQQ